MSESITKRCLEILKQKPMSPSEFRKAMESAAARDNKPLDDFAMAIAYAMASKIMNRTLTKEASDEEE